MLDNTGYESGLYSLLVGIINLYFLLDSFDFFSSRRNLLKNKHFYVSKFFSLTLPSSFILSSYWLLGNIFNIIFPNFTVIILTSAINTLLLYYITVYKRHTGNMRGLGAPGNFLFILNLSNLGFAIGSIFGKNTVHFLANLLIIEFGFIFIVSGVYKLNSGYRQNRGIEIGLYNPMWNYFSKYWKNLKTNSVLHKIFNSVAIWGEIIAGILMISVKFNILGAIIILIMFLGIGLLVRLGTIVPSLIVMVFSNKISVVYNSTKPYQSENFNIYLILSTLILLCNFFVYLVMNFNFYSRKSIPIRSVQRVVDSYIRLSGIVMWRVFTADITAIYVEIYNSKGKISLWNGRKFSRWNCVLEAISIVSVITALKYTHGDEEFMKRLKNYIKTLDKYQPTQISVYFINTESNTPVFEESLTVRINGSTLELVKGPAFSKILEPEPVSKIYRNNRLGSYNIGQ